MGHYDVTLVFKSIKGGEWAKHETNNKILEFRKGLSYVTKLDRYFCHLHFIHQDPPPSSHCLSDDLRAEALAPSLSIFYNFTFDVLLPYFLTWSQTYSVVTLSSRFLHLSHYDNAFHTSVSSNLSSRHYVSRDSLPSSSHANFWLYMLRHQLALSPHFFFL